MYSMTRPMYGRSKMSSLWYPSADVCARLYSLLRPGTKGKRKNDKNDERTGIKEAGEGGRHALLVEECPDVDDKDHNEQHAPAGERAQAPAEALLVEQKADADGADDLGKPVDQVIQRPRADVEHGAVVIIELYSEQYRPSLVMIKLFRSGRPLGHCIRTPCVEPITREEHGEEQDNPGVRAESHPEPPELCLPRWVAGDGDSCAVRSDHLARIDHKQRY